MARGPVTRGACPAPGCTHTASLAPGARCPAHDRPLVDVEVLRAHGDDPLIGRSVAGDYDLVDIIGRGAMGAVYRGWQRSKRRTVAVKVISARAAQALDEPVKRFVMEARALAAMPPHPGIVDIYDYGEDAGLLYMVLELVAGPSLKEFGRARRLPPWQVAEIATGVLGALGEAHEAGVVHRDLKPSNVVLCSDDPFETRVKVLDFGVAKVFWPDDALVREVVTRAGMALGTPKYMSPEQARGQTVGPGSDIYALGVMMYRLLSGELPFEGDNDLRILKAHILEPPPPWPEGVEVPPALDAIVRRALEKRPIDRFPTAGAMARALKEIRPALGGPGGARGEPGARGGWDPTLAEFSSTQVAAELAGAPEHGGPGHLRGAVLIGVAVLMGVVVGLLALSAAPDEPFAVAEAEPSRAEPAKAAPVTAARPVEAAPATADEALDAARAAARAGDAAATAAALETALRLTADPAALRARVRADAAFDAVREDARVLALIADPTADP
ncbi:MAG: serine/threonine protein kinase [Myxococcales bacterium]|nr:serine/threonine protein kinase [Myxococcales bacterium]